MLGDGKRCSKTKKTPAFEAFTFPTPKDAAAPIRQPQSKMSMSEEVENKDKGGGQHPCFPHYVRQ